MGNWQLEVFKLGICVSFPVIMFYYFNQPQLFEEWVIKKKREMYPPEHLTHNREIKDFVKQMRREQDEKMLKEMALENDK